MLIVHSSVRCHRYITGRSYIIAIALVAYIYFLHPKVKCDEVINDAIDVVVDHNVIDNKNEPSNIVTVETFKQYGTDVSWPMQQHYSFGDGDSNVSTDTKSTEAIKHPSFVQYMKGCYEKYDIKSCNDNEAMRIERNYYQPKLVHQNYTVIGYTKVNAPIGVYTILHEFWEKYYASYMQYEQWDDINIYTNHWCAPTKLLLLDPASPTSSSSASSSALLPRMSKQQHRVMIEQVQNLVEQWSGISLQFVSFYGIRSYTNHSIIAPHVDRHVICYLRFMYIVDVFDSLFKRLTLFLYFPSTKLLIQSSVGYIGDH
jgi:hypothetical protein